MSATKSKFIISETTTSAMQSKYRMAEPYVVVWVDGNIDSNNEDFQNRLAELQNIANDVYTYTQHDECINFLKKYNDMKVFMILSGTMSQQIVPLIHDIPYLDSIYIFCSNKAAHEDWSKKWNKIKGIYTTMVPICNALKVASKQFNQDDISISFANVNQDGSSRKLDQLESSFMYTQLFKEILLDMKYGKQSIGEFIEFWRSDYANNSPKLKHIAEFERDYSPQSSIRWYTRGSFVYRMLNWALRTLETAAIMKMGFFVSDLHRQIETLYNQQIHIYNSKIFTVYRGQALSKADFDKLQNNQGELISFNNFLSTTTDRQVSLQFTEQALGTSDTVGILFQMSIDPTISSTPFAFIQKESYYQEENEILFPMHTIFRIDQIRQIRENCALYEVHLKLTSDDDQSLRQLTESIRGEASDQTGWQRLGNLLLNIGQFGKAEEFYSALLEQTHYDKERALIYHILGILKDDQGRHNEASSFYDKSLEIVQKTLPKDHPSLASTYHNIGQVYSNIGDYLKALEFYGKACKIYEKALPSSHPSLATSYNSIGAVYKNTGNYWKALEFYEKARKIYEKVLPLNHPNFATSFSNVGAVYNYMGDCSKALEFYEKALELRKTALPPNHPSLAASYNNIGVVHSNMGDHWKALEFYEQAQKIYEKAPSTNHHHLATSYNNIAQVYENTRNYTKALEFYQKAHKIHRKALPSNHPNLANSYSNIGAMYNYMGDCSKALSFLRKALEIQQIALPQTHLYIQEVTNRMNRVKKKM